MRLTGAVSWRGFVLEFSSGGLYMGTHKLLGTGGGGDLPDSYYDSFSSVRGVGSNVPD